MFNAITIRHVPYILRGELASRAVNLRTLKCVAAAIEAAILEGAALEIEGYQDAVATCCTQTRCQAMRHLKQGLLPRLVVSSHHCC